MNIKEPTLPGFNNRQYVQELVLNKKPGGTKRRAKTVILITTFFITVLFTDKIGRIGLCLQS